MFTGIVECTGTVTGIDAAPEGDRRLRVEAEKLEAERLAVGESVSVSGVCLTVTARDAAGFWADVSSETLACTTLGAAAVGTRVNLERSLRLDSALGGHLVSGHVDAVGTVVERREDARSWRFGIEVPGPLMRYLAVKGSVCVDGVSLTVNALDASGFGVNIVPHTLAVTTIAEYAIGRAVNIEVDLLARYLERLLDARDDPPRPRPHVE